MRSAPWDAGVIIPNEAPVETVKDSVVNEMVDNSVAEISGPYFPDFWVRHNKSNAAADFVISVFKIAVNLNQVSFKVGFKPKLVYRISFFPAAIEIGIENRINRQNRVIRHALPLQLKAMFLSGFYKFPLTAMLHRTGG